ncbi:MAG: carboxylating nicotinate-nucleotide diphosphorylase [Actinobacteria bacterium]|uniref:Probable nicotinate-nucleotide pyrophosphorylase [carboxylating] n=1 Tax=freshwater metagenome TaxID=449393 RepID=A0A6J7K752_9ZZZZ|nr:carboxylating nicotinate-nucleotide diphosphorylase [Actinomycetota bacterium]
MTLSKQLKELISTSKLDSAALESLIRAAISEDLAGASDVTSVATIPDEQSAVAEFRSRKPGVIAGIPVVCAVLEICGVTDYEVKKNDGEIVSTNSLLLIAKGNTRALLLAERTALNFLGRLSGIATLTKSWVDEVADTKVAIRDTRKTTPGLRDLEKYAVRMGGGINHRFSLSDAALIKDNHVLAAGGVAQAFKLVKTKFPSLPLEVEVDSLEQLREVVEAGADLVLLDNMSIEECRKAVEIVSGRAKLEASGGLILSNAQAYAKTGVDYLAVGALTHSAPVLDIGLDLRME